MAGPGGRVCSKCKVLKPLEEFAKSNAHALGRAYHCKACKRLYKRHFDEPDEHPDIRCRTCDLVLPVSEFYWRKDAGKYRSDCKSCTNFKKRRSPEQSRNRNLLNNFGITADEYDLMFKRQGGVCDICKQPETDTNPVNPSVPRRLAVDHCHETGKIRSLLCGKCNKALGLLKDDPDLVMKAAEYLVRHNSAVAQ